MVYEVSRLQVARQPLAVIKLVAAQTALPQVLPKACGDVWNFIRAAKIAGAGRLVALYTGGTLAALDVECGAEVAGPFVSDGHVVPSATPGGPVAVATHYGPYHLLGQAHNAVREWCQAQCLTLAGPNWEVYGHWTDDPAKLHTDVYYLLA